MLEQVSGEKALRGPTCSIVEADLTQSNPQEGVRLVRAFLRITDPTTRLAIVHMIEQMGSAAEE
jgi:hypothetical protein